MPDLHFQVEGAEAVPFAAAPLLALKLRVENVPHEEPIHSVLLRCQIQLDVAWRMYQPREEEALRDLFGAKERWAQTLKKVQWMNTSTLVPGFTGSTTVDLQLPCSYDLNVASVKYFHALEKGIVPLALLFSGTVFYMAEHGIQVAQIPWSKETTFKLPVRVWKETIDMYFPNTGFLMLHRDVLDRFYRYKVARGIPTYEQALESLLPPEEQTPVAPGGDA